MMLAVLPTWFWDSARPLGRRFRKQLVDRHALRIFYDGDCGFCRKSVLIMRALVLSPDVQIAPAQDYPEIDRAMRTQNSWVVKDARGQDHFQTDALAEVLAHSPIFLFWPIAWALRLPPITAICDRLYRWVERHRPQLSRMSSWLQYRPLRWHTRPVTNTIVTFFLLYVIWWNIGTVDRSKFPPVEYRWVGVLFRVDQIWDMFTPGPLRDDGWYVVDATLKNGQHIDLMRQGAPVSYARPTPDAVAGQYTSERWRKYLLNLYGEDYAPYRLYYGRYLCRLWNDGKSESDANAVDTFEINFMARSNAAPGVSLPIQKWILHRHSCWK
jgi:predicted DCC family thiol-disulfide oxidoreductase YuxK